MVRITNQKPPSDDPRVNKNRELQARYRARIREKRREWNNQWMMTNREKYTFLRVQSNAKRKRDVLLLYANPICCQSCGFDQIDGLVLDHINDDGTKHRKDLNISCRGNPGGKVLYDVIRRKGKMDGLQILCANCNTMKHIRRLRSMTLMGDKGRIEVVEKILRGES